MKTKTDIMPCKTCGDDFRARYDFKTGILKSRVCPSCQYTQLVDKAKDKLGIKEKPNKRPNIPNGKKRNGSKSLNAKKKNGRKKRTIDKRLDEVWSKLVKIRVGYQCEVCGKSITLNSHHIYSRTKKSVRWDVENGICLCVNHHIGNEFSAHKTMVEFSQWLIEYKGESFMSRLRIKSHRVGKYTEYEKELLLKELQKEVKELEIQNNNK